MHRPFTLVSLSFLIACFASVNGQLVNGQFFTQGLAISDAPAPASQHHTGGTLPIAIDVSGNGKLVQAASVPGSDLSTAFRSLDIYLVSAETSVNLTVSSGPQLLQGEQGSTVKHLNWPIPSCLPQGAYNLTYYEGSRIDGQVYYSITPIPISILSTTAPSSPCLGVTQPEAQPQASSPPAKSPFLDPNYKPNGAVVSGALVSTTTLRSAVTPNAGGTPPPKSTGKPPSKPTPTPQIIPHPLFDNQLVFPINAS
jgi:hypothetical protein